MSSASYIAPLATSSFVAPPAPEKRRRNQVKYVSLPVIVKKKNIPLLIRIFRLYSMASAMLTSVGGFWGWEGSGVGQLGTGGSTGIVEKKDSEDDGHGHIL